MAAVLSSAKFLGWFRYDQSAAVNFQQVIVVAARRAIDAHASNRRIRAGRIGLFMVRGCEYLGYSI